MRPKRQSSSYEVPTRLEVAEEKSFMDSTPLAQLSAPLTQLSTGLSKLGRRGRSCRLRKAVEHGHARRLQDDYELDSQVLGEGGFGTVHRARPRFSKLSGSWQTAVKAVKKCNAVAERFVKKEISILRALDHPCICRLFETFEDHKCHYLVMEFIQGQELFDFVNAFNSKGMVPSEQCSSAIMRQVFSALQYCHERRVIHRDLKPENIMIKAGDDNDVEVKLIDFGLATLSHSDGMESGPLCGTEEYMAPEVRRRGKFSTAADMWSAGMVLYTLLDGDLPPPAVLTGAKPVDSVIADNDTISEPARSLLQGLLHISPSKRMSAAKACEHPFSCEIKESAPPTELISDSIEALKEFHRSSPLRRAALTALAKQMTSQQTQKLRQQFLAIDANGNGRISREEFISATRRFASEPADRKSMEEIFASVDTDGSGDIEYTEWVAATLRESVIEASEEAIIAAFNVFDLDRSGEITQEEMTKVLQGYSEEMPDLDDFDLNGDGTLNLHEFKALLLPCTLAPDAIVLYLDDDEDSSSVTSSPLEEEASTKVSL
eukprot:CAMPEP_0178438300 /NCGR_PEP_ID=MMETSP0689_2-20121128/35516_1 /TAXON_ID=160604 /ORGANISM="Amphidinium massartii, Strain CS-259" /LENGTH=546 /DNA_ID=CAMNT_0020060687 /DNA_START=67 /DNA_END=1707 /DNA_ORIENTATION=-